MATTEERAKRVSIGGALLAALAASSCCLGPLVLAALGVGGVGAIAALAAYRPYLLVGTAVLLLAGFYLTYRRPPAVAGDPCRCERPRSNRAGRIGLWIATVVVVLVAAAPPLLAKWAQVVATKASVTGSARLAKASIDVRGIDCAECAAPIRKALGKVGGLQDLELDISGQAARVTYEPAPGRLDAYVAAIIALGYEASLPAASKAQR